MNPKQLAGEKAADYIQPGMTVGLGTGSTAYFFVEKLGQMVREGLDIKGIPTSKRTENQAHGWGISLLPIDEVQAIDVVVDGADEFDPSFNLIKGGGGALYREKMVASLAEEMIVVAGADKAVEKLGKFPLPVEVVPFGHGLTLRRLVAMGLNPRLRQQEDGKPYLTDNANYLLDCYVEVIDHPEALHQRLKSLTGVVETGLFTGMASQVIVGYPNGHVEVLERR